MILLEKDFYSVKGTKKKGRGVFARKEIPAGTLIGDYTGKIIKDEEIDALEKKYDNACYAMDYNNNGTSIFPLDIKAVGIHLLNHSCAPNCDTYFYYGHTLFFTLRKIWPGEELTIDYSFDPDVKEGLLHACFCGSHNCRGTMYASDNCLKDYGAFCREQTKGQKFKIQPAGTILEKLDKYPKDIKDFPNFNLFANSHLKPVVLADLKIPAINVIRKRLRETGRALKFSRLGLTIWAVVDGELLAKK
jgi:hypothetical protein